MQMGCRWVAGRLQMGFKWVGVRWSAPRSGWGGVGFGTRWNEVGKTRGQLGGV